MLTDEVKSSKNMYNANFYKKKQNTSFLCYFYLVGDTQIQFFYLFSTLEWA